MANYEASDIITDYFGITLVRSGSGSAVSVTASDEFKVAYSRLFETNLSIDVSAEAQYRFDRSQSVFDSKLNVWSNVNLYTTLDTYYDSSNNLLDNNDHDDMVDGSIEGDGIYYDSSKMWLTAYFIGNDSLVLNIDKSKLIQFEHYVLTFDRTVSPKGFMRTPNVKMNISGVEVIPDVHLVNTHDRLVYRFRTPMDNGSVDDATITISLDNTIDNMYNSFYSFENFGLFTASNYEYMLSGDVITARVDYTSAILSNSITIRNTAISTVYKYIIDIANTFIKTYFSAYTDKKIDFVIVHKDGEVSDINGTDGNLTITMNVYEPNTTNLILSEIILLNDFFMYTYRLGKFNLSIDDDLGLTKFMSVLVSCGLFTSSKIASSSDEGVYDVYTVELPIVRNSSINVLSKTNLPARHKIPNAYNSSIIYEPTTVTSMTNTGIVTTATLVGDAGGVTDIWVGSVSERNVVLPNTITYEKDTSSEWDSTKNVYNYSVFPNFKLNPKSRNIGRVPRGSATDSFSSYKEFYYESLPHAYIEDIYHSEEWFRLYGTNRETDVKNVFSIKRKMRGSILLLDGIPIEYTKFRLIEYMNTEYIVVDKETDITTFGELHVPNHGLSKSDSALYIHRDGVVNTTSIDGIFVGDYSNLLRLTKGVHYISTGYVALGDNYLVINSENKIISYPTTINIKNKIINIVDDVVVYLPIKESTSMFESILKLLYEIHGQDVDYWIDLLDKFNNHSSLSQFNSTVEEMKYVPNLTSLEDHKSSLMLSSDINIFLKEYTSEQRAFIFEEFDLEVINNPISTLEDNLFRPKILLPIRHTNYNILVFMNGRLLKVNPERFNDDFIYLDLFDVYVDDSYSFTNTHRFDAALKWYETNKENHIFEVKLYDKEDVILENTFTSCNDNFIPIPIHLADRNFEIYIDGINSNSYFDEDDNYLNNLTIAGIIASVDKTVPLIPALFCRNTVNQDTYNTGSKAVIICTKNAFETKKMPVFNHVVEIEQGIYSDTEFFFNNGLKMIPGTDIYQVSSHSIIVWSDVGDILVKTRTRTEENYNTMNTSYGCEFLAGFIRNDLDTYYDLYENLFRSVELYNYLYKLDEDEFNVYKTVVCASLLMLKNGLPLDASGGLSVFNSPRNAIGKGVFNADLGFINADNTNTYTSFELRMYGLTNITTAYYAVIRKISPDVYFEVNSMSDALLNNKHIYRKISYYVSLFFAEYMSQAKVNKFDLSLFDDPTIPYTLSISIPSDVVEAYSLPFGVNNIGAFDSSYLTTKTATIFDVYDVVDRIPVPYGILPSACFAGSGNSAVNPEDSRLSSLRTINGVSAKNLDEPLATHLAGIISAT